MKKLLLLCVVFSAGYFTLSAQEAHNHQVFFELDKDQITQTERAKLEAWLTQFSDTLTRVEVIGHADFLGSSDYNMKLSERRAKAVAEYLENNSHIPYRMSLVSAKGEKLSKPNGLPDGNPNDRRVEISVQPIKRAPTESQVSEQKQEEPQVEELDIIERATVGQKIVLKNLNFFPGRHFLIPEALPELERLTETLLRNPTIEIEIQGHICCKLDSMDAKDINTGTFELSHNRAKYIYDQLVLAGVSPDRMSYKGFAGSRPLYNPEITARHRNRNRRVEIKILKK